jgi:hypothetical protein
MSEELGTSIEFVQVRLKVEDDGRLWGWSYWTGLSPA